MHAKVVATLGLAIAASLATVTATHAAERQYASGNTIECSSQNRARQRCDMPWRDARLERQLSDTRCIRGENWGVDRHSIWVDRGCAGRFVASGEHARSNDQSHRNNNRAGNRTGWQPDPSWNRRFSVTCESQDGRDRFCQVDLGGAGHASLARQLSSTQCIEGRNWGSNRAGVWVSQGCRGVFTIDRRWR
jgi:hypothetical protein